MQGKEVDEKVFNDKRLTVRGENNAARCFSNVLCKSCPGSRNVNVAGLVCRGRYVKALERYRQEKNSTAEEATAISPVLLNNEDRFFE